jgi:hypothetical protein
MRDLLLWLLNTSKASCEIFIRVCLLRPLAFLFDTGSILATPILAVAGFAVICLNILLSSFAVIFMLLFMFPIIPIFWLAVLEMAWDWISTSTKVTPDVRGKRTKFTSRNRTVSLDEMYETGAG